jgi:GNAT superfamily N-acetyltransferase
MPVSARFRAMMDYSEGMVKSVYPVELERNAPLRDGGIVRLRPIRPDDAPRLQAFHGRLSRDSIFMRFFSQLPVLTDERAAYFTTIDYDRRLAIVATEGTDEDELIVGVGRYDRIDDEWAPDDRAEFALIVEDRVQHQGIGSVLFWALVDAARPRGVNTFIAEVLAENRRMLNLLRESGLPMRSRRASNAIHVELDLTAGSERDGAGSSLRGQGHPECGARGRPGTPAR